MQLKILFPSASDCTPEAEGISTALAKTEVAGSSPVRRAVFQIPTSAVLSAFGEPAAAVTRRQIRKSDVPFPPQQRHHGSSGNRQTCEQPIPNRCGIGLSSGKRSNHNQEDSDDQFHDAAFSFVSFFLSGLPNSFSRSRSAFRNIARASSRGSSGMGRGDRGNLPVVI